VKTTRVTAKTAYWFTESIKPIHNCQHRKKN